MPTHLYKITTLHLWAASQGKKSVNAQEVGTKLSDIYKKN